MKFEIAPYDQNRIIEKHEDGSISPVCRDARYPRLLAATPDLLAACKLAHSILKLIPAFGDSIGDEISKTQIGILVETFKNVIAESEETTQGCPQ